MPTLEVLPHVVPPSSVWQVGAWWVSLNEHAPEPVPRHLRGWDYDAETVLGCTVHVDVERLREGGSLEAETHIELVAIVDCPATGDRWCAWRRDLPDGGSHEYQVEIVFDPRTVGGTIRVDREVVLAEARPATPPLASRKGSVLLRDPDPLRLALEGLAGRFPVEVVDFRPIGQPARALWFLDIETSDPHAAFLSTVRLYLNKSHPAVVQMLESPESDRGAVVLSMLHWDVVRQLVTRGLSDDLPWGEADDEGDSLIGVIRRLVQDVLELGKPESVRSLMDASPSEFEATLQQRTGLLRDV